MTRASSRDTPRELARSHKRCGICGCKKPRRFEYFANPESSDICRSCASTSRWVIDNFGEDAQNDWVEEMQDAHRVLKEETKRKVRTGREIFQEQEEKREQGLENRRKAKEGAAKKARKKKKKRKKKRKQDEKQQKREKYEARVIAGRKNVKKRLQKSKITVKKRDEAQKTHDESRRDKSVLEDGRAPGTVRKIDR